MKEDLNSYWKTRMRTNQSPQTIKWNEGGGGLHTVLPSHPRKCLEMRENVYRGNDDKNWAAATARDENYYWQCTIKRQWNKIKEIVHIIYVLYMC